MEDGGGCGGDGGGGGGGGSDGCSSDGGAANGGDSSSFLAQLAERIGEPDVYTPTVDVTGNRGRVDGLRRSMKHPGTKGAVDKPKPGLFTPVTARESLRRRPVEDDDGELSRSVAAHGRGRWGSPLALWVMSGLLLVNLITFLWIYFGR